MKTRAIYYGAEVRPHLLDSSYFLCLLRIVAVTVPSQYDNRFYYATRKTDNQPHCPHWMG